MELNYNGVDAKQSPEMNKKKNQKQLKSPPQLPPEIDLPASKVNLKMGITPSVFRFLEVSQFLTLVHSQLTLH